MQIDVRLFAAGMRAQIAGLLAQKLNAAKPRIEAACATVVISAIKESPEGRSLASGGLRHELGVKDGVTAIREISEAVARGLRADVFGPKGEELASIVVSVLRTDLSEVLGLPAGSFRSKGGQVDWLNWLLTSGPATVLADFSYLGEARPASRTGTGVMVHSRRGWKVPQEFAGTTGENFLTRAMDSVGDEVLNVMLGILL